MTLTEYSSVTIQKKAKEGRCTYIYTVHENIHDSPTCLYRKDNSAPYVDLGAKPRRGESEPSNTTKAAFSATSP